MKKLIVIIVFIAGVNVQAEDWPKKLWEKEWTDVDSIISEPRIGLDQKSVLVRIDKDESHVSYWVSGEGVFYALSSAFDADGLMYFDSNLFVYHKYIESTNNRRVVKLTRGASEVLEEQFEANLSMSVPAEGASPSHIGLEYANNKLICWDFSVTQLMGKNNNTNNGRLIIKTTAAGTSVLSDGKLGGEAELEKSYDLKYWQKLVDIPEEASEVSIDKKETGSEFFRLKKKED